MSIISKEFNLYKMFWGVLVFSGTITKYHRLSGSHNGNLFSHSSRCGKSKIKVLANLVPGERCLFALLCPLAE